MPKQIDLLNNDELFAALKRTRMRLGKLVFGTTALVMVVLGLGFYIFSTELGIASDTAEPIAVAFLFAGVFDYLILHFWDQIFNRMS